MDRAAGSGHMGEMKEALIALFWFVVFCAVVTLMLLGLTWLYIEHGAFAFALAVGVLLFLSVLPRVHRQAADTYPALPGPGRSDVRQVPDDRRSLPRDEYRR